MIPWYVHSFGRDYAELYAHRDDDEAEADVRALIALIAPKKQDPLLDLGCGTGRHLVALQRAGFQTLVGLDLSSDLLAIAAERLRPIASESARLIRVDMRNIPYESYFATVLSLFTSFGYFEQDEANMAVLRAVERALRPGGQLLLDHLNRAHVRANLVPSETQELDGRHLHFRRGVTTDGRRVKKTTRVVEQDGTVKVFHESVRMYTLDEMEEMLSKAGFLNVRSYGSLLGDAYSLESPRLVLVAEKGGARASSR